MAARLGHWSACRPAAWQLGCTWLALRWKLCNWVIAGCAVPATFQMFWSWNTGLANLPTLAQYGATLGLDCFARGMRRWRSSLSSLGTVAVAVGKRQWEAAVQLVLS